MRIYFIIFLFIGFTSSQALAFRSNIRIVGSSTVFPFSATVAEQFGRRSFFKTPIIESTGSGGGFKVFCGGVGVQYPDIVNASRRIKLVELKRCKKNGVSVVEFIIGTDGVVMANSREAPLLNLSEELIFTALAEDNGFSIKPSTWDQAGSLIKFPGILPTTRIKFYGPPATSGTRDAFVELIMKPGAKKLATLFSWDKKDIEEKASVFRVLDGVFTASMENDNLIIKKISIDPKSVGIFGFSFLENNLDIIQGVQINGIDPTFENIVSGEYPASRPLYFYVKKQHLDFIPGLHEYIRAFISEQAIGEYGYVVDKGLIPLNEKPFHDQLENVEKLSVLTEETLSLTQSF